MRIYIKTLRGEKVGKISDAARRVSHSDLVENLRAAPRGTGNSHQRRARSVRTRAKRRWRLQQLCVLLVLLHIQVYSADKTTILTPYSSLLICYRN